MFIRRNEWESKCDTNRALLKDKEEKIEIINMLTQRNIDFKQQTIKLQEELNHKEEMIKIQRERIETANKDYNTIMETNQKLIEWVNKIINDVGIYEVHDRKSITIPIYKNPVKTYSGNIKDLKEQLPDFMNHEEILIPEIRFIKLINKGEK